MRFLIYQGLILTFVFGCDFNSYGAMQDKEVEYTMRAIGHQIMLAHGDSTTRVLPIQRSGQSYVISFAKDWAFVPGEVVNATLMHLQHKDFASNYVIEVKECSSNEVVYSYMVGDLKRADMLTCAERDVSAGCYQVYLTWEIQEEVQEEKSNQLLGWSIGGGVLLLLFVVWMNRKKPKDETQFSIGQFTFDSLRGILRFGKEDIELTEKEKDLLQILFQHRNETVTREDLLHHVWQDEGAYEGRTLDVYVSKLRKKLEADSNILLENVRGVGYKLIC